MVVAVSVDTGKQRETSSAEGADEVAASGPRHALRGPHGKEDDTKEASTVIVARYIADEGGPADGVIQTHAAS
jgi:hypothetical protein